MDPPIVRGLNDKLYDRRKAAALELEKVVSQADTPKVTAIINQLCQMFTSPSSPLHTRNGGLIGLAATAIALGQDFAKWLGMVIPRVLACFGDAESRVRYYACESLYNIAKVCKGEILVHFNGIFDALSKLSADSEASVKNGAELLDRLLKDIVSETALNYVSRYPENVDRTFGDWEAEWWFEQRRAERRRNMALAGNGYGWGSGGGRDARGKEGGEKGISHPLEESPVMSGIELPGPGTGRSGAGKRTSVHLEDGRGMERDEGHRDGHSRDHSPSSIPQGIKSPNIHPQHRMNPSQSSNANQSHHANHLSVNQPSGPTASSPSGQHGNSTQATPNKQELQEPKPRLAFSLAKFVPLLAERIYVISPFTRSHLVSWITILDSIPDLELVSYLPEFLDGLLKYLSDPNPDVKIATENVLADFLREIKHIARVQSRHPYGYHGESAPQTGRYPTYGFNNGYAHGRRVSDMHGGSGGYPLRRRESKLTMNTDMSEADSMYTGTNTAEGERAEVGVASPDPGHLDELREVENEDADGVDGKDGDAGDRSLLTSQDLENEGEEEDLEEHGAWIPGQGVFVDHPAIMDIMTQHLSYPDEQIQSIALKWISSFLTFVQEVMVPFTPRLIPAILPNLAHHVPYIQSVANETNQLLYRVIQALPAPNIPDTQRPQPTAPVSVPGPAPTTAGLGAMPVGGSQATVPSSGSAPNSLSVSPSNLRRDTAPPDLASTEKSDRRKSLELPASALKGSESHPSIPTMANSIKPKSIAVSANPSEPQTPVAFEFPTKGRPDSPSGISIPVASAGMSIASQQQHQQQGLRGDGANTNTTEDDPFDIRETINQLTLQFLSEHEETRIAALEWLMMLHQKAPKKILARDDGTFPALLKTLSDPSEDVVKHDLQLLAQISASSDDGHFASFLVNLLELFSTDRRLLETRGSLIIRQLCLNLNAERIFRHLADILEKDDDLEFASLMVVKLNMILITSPELAEFRKRLKNIETKDGQMLFTSIYKSWCHNAVAVFALCLLSQAYEHASNLLQIFAELEMTVALLVQIDKLVMLIESPVFTSLRLQLLEPEKHPYLFKCLYGLLMLLPQSSAFVSLRNRLSAVSSMGFLHIPKPSTYTQTVAATRSKISARDEIKWDELLRHFRAVQNRHEKSRRQAAMGESNHSHTMSGFQFGGSSAGNSPSTLAMPASTSSNSGGGGGTQVRRGKHLTSSRKDSGHSSINSNSKAATLSPLNPKRASSASGMSSAALSLGAPFASSIQHGGVGGIPIVNRPKSPPGSSATNNQSSVGSRRILPNLRRG